MKMSCRYFFTGSFFVIIFPTKKNFKFLNSMKLSLNRGFNHYQAFLFKNFYNFFETFEASLRKTEHNHFLE